MTVHWNRAAVDRLAGHRSVRDALDETGEAVERSAEQLAGFSSHADTGITREAGSDGQGPFVDVGYDKTRRGWHLFFFEIGTATTPARPHLRAALRKHTRR